jgi:hypothetical protein
VRVLRSVASNQFCGPAALSLITGRSVDDCVSVLKNVRHSSQVVKGVYNGEMREALNHLGYRMHVLPVRGRPTLARLLRSLRERGPEYIFLINTTGHYVVLRGRKIYDNKNPEGILVRQYQASAGESLRQLDCSEPNAGVGLSVVVAARFLT